MPTSFVKSSFNASSLINGFSNSHPNKDHVPELKIALLVDFSTGAAANAHAVSWPAPAITGICS